MEIKHFLKLIIARIFKIKNLKLKFWKKIKIKLFIGKEVELYKIKIINLNSSSPEPSNY